MRYESFDKDKFHVITMISNPVRYSSRYKLYKKFEAYMKSCDVHLHTVELQLGDRPFCITDASNPYHVQLRGWDELWHKENCLKIGISQMSLKFSDWETVAWIDADVSFPSYTGDAWVTECLHQLQVYQVIQMFETAIDLGPSGQVINTHKSFMSEYIKKGALHPETTYQEWHPGFAWAARREAIDAMGGGPFEQAILGAGDRHTALALVGKQELSYHPDVTQGYKDAVKNFQGRCMYSIRKDVGYMCGTVMHNWHGKKKDRRYWDRWQILVNNQFDPSTDIKRASNGVYIWNDDMTERSIRLRDETRAYFRQRHEDSIDLV